MKKLICLALAAALILSLGGCFNFKEDEMTVLEGEFLGKVVDIREKTLLLVPWTEQNGEGAEGGLYTAAVGDESGFSAGDVVTVDYSGMTMETYPAVLGGVKSVKTTGSSDDITGFYVSVFSGLWNDDTALNDDVELLAFDLSECANLSKGEKEAVRYLCGNAFGIPDTVEGSYAELVEQGLIDGEKLSFEKGVLFSVTDAVFADGMFGFGVQKWRGGDGAIGISECYAYLDGSTWSFAEGDKWIA